MTENIIWATKYYQELKGGLDEQFLSFYRINSYQSHEQEWRYHDAGIKLPIWLKWWYRFQGFWYIQPVKN